MFHVRSSLVLKICILLILGAMLIFAGCERPKYHYIYNVKAEVYVYKGNHWTVINLGPKTIEVNSRKDALSDDNLHYILFSFPEINRLRKSIYEPLSETYETYYDFEFGILHIKSQNPASLIQKQYTESLFFEGGWAVSFHTQPLHYDPALVQYVITHAVPDN